MNTDENTGVFDVIASEEHELPTAAEPTLKESDSKEDTSGKAEEESPFVGDEQDFSRQPKETKTAPSKTETETETETTTETETKTEEVDWRAELPPPPAPYQGIEPEIDDNGQLTNMTAKEYAQYIEEKTTAKWRAEMHTQHTENRALDEAEKILPELKTNPRVRQMVQNIRLASVVDGKNIDAYEAAKQVKELLGEYKAAGAQNAKVSITTQKNSAIETQGATQKPVAPSRADKLDRRLKSGDDAAFAELFSIMDEEGKL